MLLSSMLKSHHSAEVGEASPLVQPCKIWGKSWLIYLLNIWQNENISLVATTLGIPCKGRCPFTFRNALITHGTDSTKCWKQSTEILVHRSNMTGQCRCLRFVKCTSVMQSFGALLAWDLVTMQAMSCSRHQVEMVSALWHGTYQAGTSHKNGGTLLSSINL